MESKIDFNRYDGSQYLNEVHKSSDTLIKPSGLNETLKKTGTFNTFCISRQAKIHSLH